MAPSYFYAVEVSAQFELRTSKDAPETITIAGELDEARYFDPESRSDRAVLVSAVCELRAIAAVRNYSLRCRYRPRLRRKLRTWAAEQERALYAQLAAAECVRQERARRALEGV